MLGEEAVFFFLCFDDLSDRLLLEKRARGLRDMRHNL